MKNFLGALLLVVVLLGIKAVHAAMSLTDIL